MGSRAPWEGVFTSPPALGLYPFGPMEDLLLEGRSPRKSISYEKKAGPATPMGEQPDDTLAFPVRLGPSAEVLPGSNREELR